MSNVFSKWKIRMCAQSLSRVWLFVTPWTGARQAPLSLGFPKQEYWSGLPFPSPGHLPNPGIKHGSPTLRVYSLPPEPPRKPNSYSCSMLPLLLLSLFSHVWLCATPWTVARQAPLSGRFPKQEYWSGLPCPPPGSLPDSGIEPRSPTLQADSLPSEPPGKPHAFHAFT